LIATAQLSNGITQDVSAVAAWSSTNPGVAAVMGGLVSFRAAGSAEVTVTYQGRRDRQSMQLAPATPRTSAVAGQYLVNTDIAAGRYYAEPASGCYWERQSGLSGALADVAANDFVASDEGQSIVDIRASDVAFSAKSGCGTWSQTPRGGTLPSIRPGTWLVGPQISAGTYRALPSPGCYWERVHDFEGVVTSIVANDFISSAAPVLVTISADDVGFHTNGACGVWTRASPAPADDPLIPQSRFSIDANWQASRALKGLLR
jgi:hypothetical protein